MSSAVKPMKPLIPPSRPVQVESGSGVTSLEAPRAVLAEVVPARVMVQDENTAPRSAQTIEVAPWPFTGKENASEARSSPPGAIPPPLTPLVKVEPFPNFGEPLKSEEINLGKKSDIPDLQRLAKPLQSKLVKSKTIVNLPSVSEKEALENGSSGLPTVKKVVKELLPIPAAPVAPVPVAPVVPPKPRDEHCYVILGQDPDNFGYDLHAIYFKDVFEAKNPKFRLVTELIDLCREKFHSMTGTMGARRNLGFRTFSPGNPLERKGFTEDLVVVDIWDDGRTDNSQEINVSDTYVCYTFKVIKFKTNSINYSLKLNSVM